MLKFAKSIRRENPSKMEKLVWPEELNTLTLKNVEVILSSFDKISLPKTAISFPTKNTVDIEWITGICTVNHSKVRFYDKKEGELLFEQPTRENLLLISKKCLKCVLR